MPLHPSWQGLLARLLLAAAGGGIFGFERSEGDQPVGLRTTLLTSVAAALSMLQANLLLATSGKPADSFVVLDLMRLPLGILSGVGFLGAGAIMHQGDRTRGVTTAATLWFTTTLGLCFGGGQLWLGGAALVVGLGTLRGLKWIERVTPRHRRGTLEMRDAGPALDEVALRAELEGAHLRVRTLETAYGPGKGLLFYKCEVSFWGKPDDPTPPPAIRALLGRPGFQSVTWRG